MAAATTTVRTLLVEDDADTSEAISRVLGAQGFEVEWCRSAGAALVKLELEPKPGAAIIDLGLPDATGGIVLWRIRRDYGKSVPVAVVTGVPDPLSRPELAREQPDRLFVKPVDLRELVAWLKSVT